MDMVEKWLKNEGKWLKNEGKWLKNGGKMEENGQHCINHCHPSHCHPSKTPKNTQNTPNKLKITSKLSKKPLKNTKKHL
jgi:hypothetical protein